MFRTRFRILSLAGIPIYIDLSWFLIAFLLSWTLADGNFPHFYPGLGSTTYWTMGITGMLGLFFCIILHELGHALMARRFEVPVSQITLFIFGGVAELKKEPKSPKAEFFIAIAGPIVSAILVIAFYILSRIGEAAVWPSSLLGVIYYLTLINAFIVIFNLVPAFPLDGGRILRSILWGWKKNLAKATKVTTAMGAGFGFFLLFLGIFSLLSGSFVSGIWLIILGLFLQKAALMSQTQFYISKELEGETVEKFMKTSIDSSSPDITVQDLIDDHIYLTHHHLYPVVENTHLIGYVSVQEAKTVEMSRRKTTLVRNIMLCPTKEQLISPKQSALSALEKIHEAPFPTLFVVEEGRFIGVLTAQDLLKVISLKLELEGIHKH
jgi:Zn-dependent protease/predicted transcriptional regulator